MLSSSVRPAPASGVSIDVAEIASLLEHAVRAPSVLNTQPWAFVVDARGDPPVVHLDADRSRQLRALDPDGRELVMSCGAALYTLSVAANHDGWDLDVTPFPSSEAPDRLATIAFRPGLRPQGDDRLFRALATRRTNRQPFQDEPVAFGVFSQLAGAAAIEGAALHVLTDTARKRAVAELVQEGVRALGADPAVSADLDAWLRPPRDPRPDGIADAAQGLWDRHAAFRTPADVMAPRKAALVRESPAVLVLTTPADTPADWLRAGRALARVLVTGADRGLAASYANEPVEVATLRPRLAALVGRGVPQTVFRMGYPVPQTHSRRRYAHDVTDVVDSAT